VLLLGDHAEVAGQGELGVLDAIEGGNVADVVSMEALFIEQADRLLVGTARVPCPGKSFGSHSRAEAAKNQDRECETNRVGFVDWHVLPPSFFLNGWVPATRRILRQTRRDSNSGEMMGVLSLYDEAKLQNCRGLVRVCQAKIAGRD
jgi:hypothetical protein